MSVIFRSDDELGAIHACARAAASGLRLPQADKIANGIAEWLLGLLKKAANPGAAVLVLVFASLAGCAGAHAWVACELGKLPQTAQVIIPEAVQALEQGSEASALAALEAIGSGLAEGQLACIVQAIAADAMKHSGPAATNVVHNSAAFRVKHPKTCVLK